MGLDMFLNREVYVGGNYEIANVTGTVEIFVGKEKRPLKVKLNRIIKIVEEAAYWRKANAIHKWFVDNVQDGEDDCQKVYVSQVKLEKLLEVCKQVQENHDEAPNLLPTQGGFFFGSTDYDEYYFQDIDYTIKALEPIINDFEEDGGMYYYQSSW